MEASEIGDERHEHCLPVRTISEVHVVNGVEIPSESSKTESLPGRPIQTLEMAPIQPNCVHETDRIGF